jgi:hypothetical protein
VTMIETAKPSVGGAASTSYVYRAYTMQVVGYVGRHVTTPSLGLFRAAESRGPQDEKSVENDAAQFPRVVKQRNGPVEGFQPHERRFRESGEVFPRSISVGISKAVDSRHHL